MPLLAVQLAVAFAACSLNSFAHVESNPASIAFATGVIRGNPIQLFDGESTQGWTKRNGEKSTNWIAQEGTLFRQSGGGDLYHEYWYQDFELTFEWKIEANGNSGVKYRVQDYGKQSLGCEYQIQDDKDRPFNKQATAGLYAIYEPNKNKTANPVGEWNTSKIVVCGRHIEHWLNGDLVVSSVVGSNDWMQRVAASKFKDQPFFGQNREGRIFLQDHGNPVWFRNIVVVPLLCNCVLNSLLQRQKSIFSGV